MSNKHCPFHFEGVPWDYGVFLIKFGHIVDCYAELCCRWFFKEWVKIFCIVYSVDVCDAESTLWLKTISSIEIISTSAKHKKRITESLLEVVRASF